ncbi:MAG: tRNA preQ1(34) S-adenosylmethionine ribosyltransferase-isomerase QueA [Rickettsiales bacterium]|jgi:S-adenosylmethionine:tRNA ribosyltransferase-isomerase|nr:tRNA preQ1(34) S-adenosylmethionine ribosyltransferase-isomerase QueA [Rickettsiales bacterium]
MKVSEFDFELPADLIAQHPPERRDASRMLVCLPPLGGGDKHISDFPSFLRPGDVVVFNNSRVIPARFDAVAADGAKYEITLHTKVACHPKPHSGEGWWGLTKKFQKINIGDILTLDDGTRVIVRDKNDESGWLIECVLPPTGIKDADSPQGGSYSENSVFDVLDRVGKMPLPPYMKRGEESADRERYQTVYAQPLGSMAAPTAGLHFTPELLQRITATGAQIVNITLHVGAGTWMPIKTDDTDGHKMHSEFGVITPAQAEIINNAKRVIAIGTTSLRLLESAAQIAPPRRPLGDTPLSRGGDRVTSFNGTTDIFITPGYKFCAVDVLLTNFHLPKSTLFMLVSAFAGLPEMRAAYAHAVAEKYRFFSYGDCCLLFRKPV